jgi:pimeloyl-ACP methyl ester carboxylesterase
MKQLVIALAVGAGLALAGTGLAAWADGPNALPAAGEAARWWTDYETAPLTRLSDGRHMRVFCMGRGSPTIVLEAGLGDGAWTWRRLQPTLARATRTCSYDRAGYGASDAGPAPRDIEALASDLSALLKASHTAGPYILVGHSLGGQIVRQFAYRHRDQVAGLVLVDPAADHAFEVYAKIGAMSLQGQRAAYDPLRRCIAAAERGAMSPDSEEGRACIGPPPPDMPPELLHFHIAYGQSPVHGRATLDELEAGLNGRDAADADAVRHPLGGLPIIVLTADGNLKNPAFKPADSARAGELWYQWHAEMAQLSTRGEHRLIKATSHYIQDDQPQAVLAAIDDVLKAARAERSR